MSWEIAIIATIVGSAIGLFFAGNSLDEEHFPLKLLFLGLGLFLLILAVGVNYKIIDANTIAINNTNISGSLTNLTGTAHKTLNYGSWAVMGYFFLYILIKILMFFGKIPKEGVQVE